MADDGRQQRKPDFRTAVDDVKAVAAVFAMEAEARLGRRAARTLGVMALFAVALVLLGILKSEIVTLGVSFAIALALIWAKEWYVAKREREQKQDTLWRILTHELEDIVDADKKLEDMVRSYEQNEISPRIFLTYGTPVEYARRLAELDHQYAYFYSAYELEAEGSRKMWESLDKLREQYFQEPDEDNRRKLVKAIQELAKLIRKQTITLLETELAVLKRIKEARGKDKQPVTEYQNIVKGLKKSVPA